MRLCGRPQSDGGGGRGMIFLPGDFPPGKAAHAVGADRETVTAELSMPVPAGGTEKTEIQDGPSL